MIFARGGIMKVGELVRRLTRVDPEDTVVIDPESGCLWILNTKLGLFQPLDEPGILGLTEDDKEFLRTMNIQGRGSEKAR